MPDWIQVEADFPDHQKLGRLARRLECTKADAAWYLICLWCWARKHAPDGDLSRLDCDEIADAARWPYEGWQAGPRFYQGLVAAGFIDETETGHVLHGWAARYAKLLEAREKASDRMRRWRERDASRTRHVTRYERARDGLTVTVTETERERQKHASASPPLPADAGADPPAPSLDDALAVWREECPSLPQPREATAKRRRLWHARCRDPQFSAQWREVCRRVHRSAFCRGEREGAGWRATVDWLLERPDAWTRVLEGVYDAHGPGRRTAESTPDVRLGEHRGPVDPEREAAAEADCERLAREREARAKR